MTNKLTAKLSDGTEWEVYRRSTFEPNAETWSVTPLKQEPREWYLFFDRRDNSYAVVDSDSNLDLAPKCAQFSIIKVREVLE